MTNTADEVKSKTRDTGDLDRTQTATIRSTDTRIPAILSKTSRSDRAGLTVPSIESDPGTAVSEAHLVAFDHASEGMFVAGSHGRVLVANPVLVGLAGLDDADIVGHDWQTRLLRSIPADVTRRLRADLRDHRKWNGRIVITDFEGRERIVDLVLRTCTVPNGTALETSGPVTGGKVDEWIIGYVNDVTDDQSIEEALQEQARRDELSGLLNRAGFLDILHDRFAEAQRSGNTLSVLYIDLDNFKSINDHFGHRYGDLLLQSFAKRLRSSLKSSDVVGRIGGDEFVVLFDPALPPAAMDTVVSKLKQRLLDDYQLDDIAYTCTASLGSVDYPWDATSAEELLEFADHAMYQAKSSGKNQYARFDRDDFQTRMDRENLLGAIELGLDGMQFVPYYQPVFDTANGEIVGAEALVRWIDERDGGVVRSPGEFLGLIDGTPAGIRLGLRMFDQVVVHMQGFAAIAGPIPISVNLSAAQIRSEDVLHHIEQLATRYPDELRNLRVELTESAFYDGDPVVETNLSRIRATGATLSLDDFGTGHSSLLSLRAHDFRQVKIDQQFLSAVSSGVTADRMIFETMIELCQKLELETVCEGVETDDQLTYLRTLGCDVVQGFLLARPMPKEEFRTLLCTSRSSN